MERLIPIEIIPNKVNFILEKHLKSPTYNDNKNVIIEV